MNSAYSHTPHVFEAEASEVERLLSPREIRRCAFKMLEDCKKGLTHFQLNESQLDPLAARVAAVTQQRYPNLQVPFHSRWAHFQVGGIDRNGQLAALLESKSALEAACSKFDLVVLSVLLDAGAGPAWKFKEPNTEHEWSRSEGLAVASWYLFISGACSASSQNPFQVDGTTLSKMSAQKLGSFFQVTEDNPLMGLEGRSLLLNNLGRVIETQKEFFPTGRISGLLHSLVHRAGPHKILGAAQILRSVQDALGAIWPGRVQLNGINLGDVWLYSPWGSQTQALVPFHKLSQWLTYSLVEPLQDVGLTITGFEELSGLAEYRNGGLFVDSGALMTKTPDLLEQTYPVHHPLVIEWRALTLALLETLAPKVRELLGVTAQEMPLGKVLEGGTWWAGRELARERRRDASSPIKILSDGTVF